MKLYLHYISIVLRGAMQYKTSFFLTVIGRFLVSFNGVLGVYFMFQRFHQVRGYRFGDVLLCFAIIQLDFALAECVSSGFAGFNQTVRKGEFDRILLRPRSAILQVLGSRFLIDRLGMMLQAVFLFVYGVAVSDIDWRIGRICTLCIMVAGGALLFAGIFMLNAAISFFTIEDLRLANILTYGAQEHGKYPIDIYGSRMMKFCTFVIPYTLIQYYPLQYLTGRSMNWYYSLYPFGTAVFVVICYIVWRIGMQRYQSTGS